MAKIYWIFRTNLETLAGNARTLENFIHSKYKLKYIIMNTTCNNPS